MNVLLHKLCAVVAMVLKTENNDKLKEMFPNGTL